MSGREKSQGFSWATVKAICDVIEILLRVAREAAAFWKVLSQKSVGVFVCASLPRAAGITKVNRHVRRRGELLVGGKLCASIPCETLSEQTRQGRNTAR